MKLIFDLALYVFFMVCLIGLFDLVTVAACHWAVSQ